MLRVEEKRPRCLFMCPLHISSQINVVGGRLALFFFFSKECLLRPRGLLLPEPPAEVLEVNPSTAVLFSVVSAPASPGNVLEMQILEPLPRPTKSEALEVVF